MLKSFLFFCWELKKALVPAFWAPHRWSLEQGVNKPERDFLWEDSLRVAAHGPPYTPGEERRNSTATRKQEGLPSIYPTGHECKSKGAQKNTSIWE